MYHQTLRGAGELPADVWREGQVVGQSTAARPVRATLGGAVQQLQQRLLSQPVGCSAANHHNPTPHPALVRRCSGTPAAADQCRWARWAERWESDRQCHWIWSPRVWESQCYCFIDEGESCSRADRVHKALITDWIYMYVIQNTRMSKRRGSSTSLIECSIASESNAIWFI